VFRSNSLIYAIKSLFEVDMAFLYGAPTIMLLISHLPAFIACVSASLLLNGLKLLSLSGARAGFLS
jgi:hypothetical protein